MSGWRVSAIWREQQRMYGTPTGGLRGIRCPEGHVHLAPRPVCPECAAAILAIADEEKQEALIAVDFPVVISIFASAE